MPTDDRRAAEVFCDHFGIVPTRPDLDLLHELGHAFARLPYENLTKLIRKHSLPPGPARRRQPAEVVADHVSLGAGGTCFSLTTLFAAVLERLGFSCHPVLCDMRAGRDLHCALVVDLLSGPHLLDPAYLLDAPLPLASPQSDLAARRARVVRSDDGESANLYSFDTFRYRVKLEPASRERFLAVWDASFEWTMMNGVHVCAATPGGYAYLHGHHLRLRSDGSKQTLNVRGSEAGELARRFGIAETVAAEAYRLIAAAREGR
jgi:arylamine N-acetyltransferase